GFIHKLFKVAGSNPVKCLANPLFSFERTTLSKKVKSEDEKVREDRGQEVTSIGAYRDT
ncbi:hypothetical protein JOD17_004230, partial [Geomicrobium sediminis]|nr:hypothetical protein [Geomicrobium sediminis]